MRNENCALRRSCSYWSSCALSLARSSLDFISHPTIRCTNVVRSGSFAAASANASRAMTSSTPSISYSTVPGRIWAMKYSGLPLPLPMRTSAGFCEIGWSGNIRIQIRPPRLMWRDMARRAASIWRAVRRPRTVAFRPNSPKDTLLPRVAMPRLRPFCCLRYFVLAGCSILLSYCFSPEPASGVSLALRTRLMVVVLGLAASAPSFPSAFGAAASPAGAGRLGLGVRPGFASNVGSCFDLGRHAFGLRCRADRRLLDPLVGGPLLGARRQRGGGGLFAFAGHLAFVHPNLDADHAVGSLGFREAVVDVRTQRVQGNAPLAIPFCARNLDAVQSPRAHDLDSLRTQPHRVLHGALHRAAEHDALLQLLADRIRDELRVDLGFANFLDVDVHHLHPEELAQIGLQHLDVLALLSDHDAGPRAVDRDARVLGGALYHDLGNRCVRQLLLQVFAHLEVFVEHVREVPAVREPARTPVLVDRKPEPDRMYFLSHGVSLRFRLAGGA